MYLYPSPDTRRLIVARRLELDVSLCQLLPLLTCWYISFRGERQRKLHDGLGLKFLASGLWLEASQNEARRKERSWYLFILRSCVVVSFTVVVVVVVVLVALSVVKLDLKQIHSAQTKLS